MSFGFGFALPAYPLRGGGGNNPFNQSGPTLDLSFTGNAGNLSGADTYTLDTNFITPQYQVAAQYAVWVDGSGMTQRNFADIVTFSRGSAATQFDSTGTLIFAPMNAIRNNMMVGAVAGTLPTNWLAIIYGTGGSLATSVVGTGVENGITYVDVRINGTAGTGSRVQWYWDTATGIPAQTGQTWTLSHYAKLVGGSWTNVTTYGLRLDEFTSVGGYITGADNSAAVFPGTGALNTQRTSFTTTLNGGATTANTQPSNIIYFANGTAIDFTLRIGMPQLERGSTATAVNATSGTAYYGPRFDYNPSTLAAQGLLIEEQRTNSIRNNTMQGAVAGTPGTLPTNWSTFTTLTGLTRTLAVGTENGIAYLDIRLNGTPSAAGDYQWFEETTTQIAASSGQTWTHSAYYKLQAGTMNGISDFQIAVQERDAVGGFLGGTFTTQTTPSATTLRGAVTRTLNQATTAFVFPGFRFVFTGAPIDITLRIGLPQLEQGAFATSVIPTTTTALTRSADVASVNTLSPWFNATEGTLYVQAQDMSDAPHATSQPRAVSINNGTTSNCIDVSRLPASAQGRARVDDAGVNQFNSLNSAWPLATQAKVALAYKANDFAACLGGGAVFTDNTGTIPTVNALTIGNITTGGLNSWVGWIQRLTFYPRRLANADLQTITA